MRATNDSPDWAERGGMLAGDQLAAGDVQIAALAQELAELRRQVGELERRGHGGIIGLRTVALASYD